MNAELYGSSMPSETESSGPVTLSDLSSNNPRAEMENSVLDALRPLLRPKRKKPRPVEPAGEGNVAREADAAEPSGESDDPFAPGKLFEDRSDDDLSTDDDEIEMFAAIGEELERRSRQSATMVRLLEQHRQQLQSAEKERDAAYEKLARVVPVVQETAQALREAMDARKIDEDPARMHRLFMLNGRALDELEKVAISLFADFLWVKSAWEQYARTVDEARRLRTTLES
ncbi:MAG: hypothetical protein JWR08_2521 [Enterovirga sp.]|nr:hypothetical protein [Enterovirga sp.]